VGWVLHRLTPYLARYSWAHPSLISSWLHQDTNGPVAEAWWGTHPSGPTLTDAGPTLAELIASDPEHHLGRQASALPWLVKLLAAAEPLSLQLHPDAATAQRRFAQAHPAYVDSNAKPEALVALCPTWALVGLESTATAAHRARSLGAPTLAGVLSEGTAAAAAALWQDPELAARCAAEVARGVREHREDHPALEIVVNRWGADPSVAVAACLRPLHLSPGEAVELPPGIIHAYLSGGGLEVMGASDNVLRGGLTTKWVYAFPAAGGRSAGSGSEGSRVQR
jgi:mannose-6-phosphate isomerase